jgi:exodeoxyribonuclease VII large subunit
MSDHPLLRSLFEEQERKPVTVSELNSEIRSLLESRFPSVWVEGEITNFHAAASGHWYFSLTDGDSFIKAACFRGQNARIRFRPENGHQVRVRGRVTTYEKQGVYQLIVESLEPVGEGALAVAFEQIKAKLQAEGLFDEALKRSIPPFPRKVGVVTSPKGAAVHDILTVLRRRARSVSVIVVPTLVQGEKAGEQIVSAIGLANEYSASAEEDEKIDVLIVGRGGGSAEDLWAFNEEQVARAIRGSEIPVISAVGHEVDFTIADFAADLRAATPSAAAELVAEREDVLESKILGAREQMAKILEYRIIGSRERLNRAQTARVFHEFPQKIRDLQAGIRDGMRGSLELLRRRLEVYSRRSSDLAHRLSPARLSANVQAKKARLASLDQKNVVSVRRALALAQEKLSVKAASLDALSPLSVLTRGFSLARDENGRILRDASQVSPGDLVNVRLRKGSFDSRVVNVETEE